LGQSEQLKWTSYVKFLDPALNNVVDIRKFIRKVRFGLHRDYMEGEFIEVSDRSINNQFEIPTMTGYTQFSMPITIYFQKETGLKQEVFKLPKFDQKGVVK
jgi:transcription initiation factor IIF auxiliary subunit